MRPSRSRGNSQLIERLTIGVGGTAMKKYKKGSVVVNPTSVGAASVLEVTVTITGVAVGDIVALIPPAALEANLLVGAAVVTAADTVKFRIANPTAGAIDPASATWAYTWIDLT